MGGYVYVMEPKDFQHWLANGGEDVPHLTMEQEGARLWNKLGCGSGNCHTGADTARGPSLFGLMGKERTFTEGPSIVADEAYVRESILQPYNHITKGYENTMPAYEGQLTEEDVNNLIAYIKGLGLPGTSAASIAPSKGENFSGSFNKQTPTFSDGAIQAQLPDRPGSKPGNNSGGAQSMQPQGNHE
jgi:cytochrome c oxidase subunit 2